MTQPPTPYQGPQQPPYQGPQLQPPGQYAPGPLPPSPPENKQSWLREHWKLATLLGVILLIVIASIGDNDPQPTTLASAPAVTPVDDTSVTTNASTEESSSAPAEPTTSTRSAANIEKSDIKLHVKTLSKKCFGEFGCHVDYRVVVDGAHMKDWPESGEVEVGYRVTGPEDGPEEDSFVITLDDGQYEKPWEEFTSTRSRSAKLTVKVTSVEYSE
jgi:hypothetical protein